MSIEIYIWHGKIPDFTVVNGLLQNQVGHASMMIIDEVDPKDRLYISHRPKSSYEHLKNIEDDDSKKYILEDFCEKAQPISLEEECEHRGKNYDQKIDLFGLNEVKIRECHEKYLKGYLPESINQYHVLENNCCSMIVYFLREGLSCPKEFCNKCSPSSNLPDRQEMKARDRQGIVLPVLNVLMIHLPLILLVMFKVIELSEQSKHSLIQFIILSTSGSIAVNRISHRIRLIINIESYVAKHSSNFWSPTTLSYFVKRLAKSKNTQCLVLKADSQVVNIK